MGKPTFMEVMKDLQPTQKLGGPNRLEVGVMRQELLKGLAKVPPTVH
jgi:autonomous glycyl radical cofactor GrcA